jgi:5-methylcytosine-specific restriction endonuclease McrA
MPSSPTPLRLDCSKRAMAGTRYCLHYQTRNNAAEHRRLFDVYRKDDPIRSLYRVARWTNGTRLIVLRRDPLCMECGHRASSVADHHPLSAREIVEQLGRAEFYNPTRCRGLCKSCHDSKTAREDSSFASKRPKEQGNNGE